jgi:hypothetical protein
MGLGGIVALFLSAAIGVYILKTEKPFAKKGFVSTDPFLLAGLPKAAIVLERAPQAVESQMPPWQLEVSKKLQSEGYVLVGDYSYTADQFFWARAFVSPDTKSVLLFVNWVEGMDKGKQIIANLELYSFTTEGDFILTAAAQDGATRLLTGANRPREDQLSLHLKAVYAEIAIRPLIEEHQKRIAERETQGTHFRELTRATAVPSLSKILSV